MSALRNLLVGFMLAASVASARATDAPFPAGDPDPAEIADLIRGLGDSDWVERERATTRLIAIGAPARAALESALLSDDAEVRYRARLILRAGLRRVMELLNALLREGTSREAPAFREITAMGERAIDPLVYVVRRELQDYEGRDDERIRIALLVLEKIGSPRAVGPVLSLLELNLQQRFERPIARVLRHAGWKEARDGLRAMLAARDPLARKNAVEVLGLFRGEGVVAALATALGDADPAVRAEAIRGLRRAAGGLEGTELRGQQVRVFVKVAAATAKRADPATVEAAGEAILRALDDPDRLVEVRAIEALAALGERRVLPRLRALVKDRVLDDRLGAAVQALGVLEDRGSIPLLVPLLESERPDVAAQATQALGAMRAPEAVPGLLAVLERDEPQSHALALQALGEIGDPRAFERLKKYYLNRSYFGPLAIEAIGRLPCAEARDFLVEHVKAGKDEAELRIALERLEERCRESGGAAADAAALGAAAMAALERPAVVALALKAIERARFKPAYEAVARLVAASDAESVVREAAIEALGALGDPRAVAVLKPLFKPGDRSRLAEIVTYALGRLGDAGAVAEAIPAVEAAVASDPQDAGERMHLGILYLYRKDFVKAEEIFESILKSSSAETYSTAAYNLACTHALAGRPAEALEWLRKSAGSGKAVRGRFTDWRHMEADSDLDSIRATDGYKAVLAEMREVESGLRRAGIYVDEGFEDLTAPDFPGDEEEDP